MVQPQRVKPVQSVPQPRHPPAVLCTRVGAPVIYRIAPQLTGGRKRVRRTPGQPRRRAGGREHKQRRRRPHIGAARRHINRQIADQVNTPGIGISPQRSPLMIQKILQHFMVQNPPLHLHCRPLQSRRLSLPQSRRPQKKALSIAFTKGTKQGIILQPIGLTLAKAVKVCRYMAHKAVKQSIKQHLTPPAHSRIIHPVITTAG